MAVVGYLRIRRTHGIFGGFLVAVLGIWGGIIPFIGPYFHYAYTPDKAWTYTTGRLDLEILPGAGALLGGLILMAARSRHVALLGSLLAVASGAWFVVGNVFGPLWTVTNPAGGPAGTGTTMRVLEQIGFFSGLGVVIVLIAAAVAGRVTAVPSMPSVPSVPVAGARTVAVPAIREPAEAEETAADETEPIETR
jgi:hypothetical protein